MPSYSHEGAASKLDSTPLRIRTSAGLIAVRKQRGNERSSSLVGVLGDPVRQPDSVERCGHQQLLSRCQPQAGANGYFSQAIEALLQIRASVETGSSEML